MDSEQEIQDNKTKTFWYSKYEIIMTADTSLIVL